MSPAVNLAQVSACYNCMLEAETHFAGASQKNLVDCQNFPKPKLRIVRLQNTNAKKKLETFKKPASF